MFLKCTKFTYKPIAHTHTPVLANNLETSFPFYKNFTGKFKTLIGDDFRLPKIRKKNQGVFIRQKEPGSRGAS